MRSIQLKLRRKDYSIDYRLFINDVGGELYDTTSVDSSTSTQIRGQGENPVFRITKKYVPLNR